jgi:hypothetical protein
MLNSGVQLVAIEPDCPYAEVKACMHGLAIVIRGSHGLGNHGEGEGRRRCVQGMI